MLREPASVLLKTANARKAQRSEAVVWDATSEHKCSVAQPAAPRRRGVTARVRPGEELA